MTRFFKFLFMPCEGYTELMSNSMDTDLSPLEGFAVRVHAVYCRSCGRYRKQIRQLRTILQHMQDQPAADSTLELGPEARQRMLAALNKDHSGTS